MAMLSPRVRSPGRLLPSAAVLLIPFFLFCPVAFSADIQADYLGWKACGACHAEISSDWQKTRHAGAFSDLAKSGQEGLPGCVPCHVTGSGRPGGFVDKELTPDLEGVQCEACHGPGKKHVSSQGAVAMAAAPPIGTCRQCHTLSQDAGFDYAKKAGAVHQAVAQAAPGEKASSLVATPDYFRFGAIDEGTPATTTVALQNRSDRQMEITNVRTS